MFRRRSHSDRPLELAHPLNRPVNLTPITLGHCNSHGSPAIASTASEPPTPMPIVPMPPALGVWESVLMIKPPGLDNVRTITAVVLYYLQSTIFEDDSMNDSRSRLLESYVVTFRGGRKKLIDLPSTISLCKKINYGQFCL